MKPSERIKEIADEMAEKAKLYDAWNLFKDGAFLQYLDEEYEKQHSPYCECENPIYEVIFGTASEVLDVEGVRSSVCSTCHKEEKQ